MKLGRWKSRLATAMATALLATMTAYPRTAMAQSAKGIMMYEDTKTGAFYSKPGKGRIAIGRLYVDGGAPPPTAAAVQEQVQQVVKKHDDELRAEFMQNQQTLLQKNTELSQQVAEIKPAWQDYLGSFKNKVSFGTLVWFDYGMFSHTGWGPQHLTQMNWPGPGNNGYNSFYLNRAYLNFLFYPTEDWTVRVTPNIYTATGATTNQAFGRSSAYSSSITGDLNYRLKYAYLQWNSPFKHLGIDAIKNDSIVMGEIPNPETAWEEDLYGYRFVNLTTWNWAESSTFPGISVQGPITFGAENTQYIDYNIGAYNNAGFHALEATNTKEVQGRISFYPFGAKWRFQGLGLTGYYTYGFGNATPDLVGLATPYKAPNAVIERFAAIAHYSAETWGLAFEYDWGRNAWTTGNQFSSSGPAAVFGLTPSSTLPASVILNQAAYSNLATALLNNGRSYQAGYNFFGHYHIPETELTLFGWLKQWNPNTKVRDNPFDFQTVTLGVSYQWNEYLRFAFDTQNTLFYHSQYNFPVSYAKQFNFVAPTHFTGAAIPDVVTPDTHSFFLNAEFAF